MKNSRRPVRQCSSSVEELSVRSAPRAKTGVRATVSEDEIRIHAYQLYERRLSERRRLSEDHSMEDWLAAETHLKARKNRASKTTAS